ncbi:hypothetical protein Pmani_035032 [Petrolisthes manimaculis]|uniref:ubiquitinyl hydrolase 1 n=1 Tax=Petrolisthes manimaculis TaxID=1843537 RepID=A0AAE1NMR4_9EUCA|nr:hypothetical protein Pmani_035032 [Petrolisthes manimaculis]
MTEVSLVGECECRVSSVLGRNTRTLGKQHLFDGSPETCWNSDQGTPQWVALRWAHPVTVTAIVAQFQGGFCGSADSVVEVGSEDGVGWEDGTPWHLEDVGTEQTLRLSHPRTLTRLRITFTTSTDFFGRIIMCRMEGEKVSEFISHTQADPILARQILQSVNWDVEAGVRMYTVLRGASPFHHSGPVRSAPSKLGGCVKPPVAPKPVFDHKPGSETRLIADGRLPTPSSKLAPLPPPRVRKAGGVLPKNAQMVGPVLPLPPVSQDVLQVASSLSETPYHQKAVSVARVSSLPPIQKCSGPDYCTQVSVSTSLVPGINKSSSKSHIGNAKNALLIEKVRGTSASLQEGHKTPAPHHETFTRASSFPHSSSPSQITINRSCVISVNNPNNNTNKNNNLYLDDYPASSVTDSGTPQLPLPMSHPTITTTTTTTAITTTTNTSYSSPSYPTPPSLDSAYIHSPSAVPSAHITTASPSDVSVGLFTIDTLIREPKPVRSQLGSCRDYISSVPITREASNCTCDCREIRQIEKPNHIDKPSQTEKLSQADRVSKDLYPMPEEVKKTNRAMEKKSIREDEVDRVVIHPDVVVTVSGVATGAGPSSLSAPCSPAKPLLRKTEAVDLEEYDYYKKLSRGISKATDNVNLVSKARSEFAQEIWEAMDASRTPFFIETPVFTFTLPDLSIYSDEFRAFLERDLIETSTLVSLESAGRLNWWALVGASQRLWPLATTGDGNCLLHAASLGMWGFHDRLLTLRKALHEFLTRSKFSRPLWRRWRWQVTQQNRETGLVYSQEEWENEWANVLRLASSAPRGEQDRSSGVTGGGGGSITDAGQKVKSQASSGGSKADPSMASKRLSNGFSSNESEDCAGRVYESLEEIHVLALAHVLRRPIIVVADLTLKDVSGEPLAPIPFGGVYLPLECPPSECQRSPLLLTYDAAHFSALVVMEANSSPSLLPAVIPVTDCCHELLPIQFVIDPGDDFVWGRDDLNETVIHKLTITTHDKIGLLNEYLDVVQVAIPPSYLESCQGVEEMESPDNYHPEVEKKSSESSFDSDEGPPYTDGMGAIFPGKGKASKQLQTVAKQFGSIGKTMSKKIKKNLGTLSKLGRTGSFKKKDDYAKSCGLGKNGRGPKVSTHQNYILAAAIHTEKRHAYQEEMVRNYLNNARRRFEKDLELRKRQEEEVRQLEREQLERQAEVEGPVQCINPGCSMFGTALTAYMCSACFAKQREQEQEYKRQTWTGPGSPKAQHQRICDGPQYGAGRSKFYAELDANSVSDATRIPIQQPLSSKKDGTIYLSNSTFYNDVSSVPSSYNMAKTSSTAIKNEASSGEKLPTISTTTTTAIMANHVSDKFTPVAGDEGGMRGTGERSESPSHPCLTQDCKFYGSYSTGGYCSRCYQDNPTLRPKSVMVQQIKSVHL